MKGVNTEFNDRVRYTLTHGMLGSKVITEPNGWNDDQKEFVRHSLYKGVITKFSNNLEFIEDGAEFINDVKNTYGINAEIFLLREVRHPYTDEWITDYEGVLDLSEWQEQDFKVKVKFNSSGLESLLKARETEKVEIERTTALDGSNIEHLKTETLSLDGRRIFLKSNFSQSDDKNIVLSAVSNGNNKGFYTNRITSLPLDLKSKQHKEASNNYYRQFHAVVTGYHLVKKQIADTYPRDYDDYKHLFDTPVNSADCFFVKSDEERKLNIKGNIRFNYRATKIENVSWAHLTVTLTKFKKGVNTDFVFKEDFILYRKYNVDNWKNHNVSIDLDKRIDLEEGESLGLFISLDLEKGGGLSRGYLKYNLSNFKSNITIEEDSFEEGTSTKIVMVDALGDRLVNILTGRKDSFYSECLGRKSSGYLKDGALSQKGYACGHWIRGFDKFPLPQKKTPTQIEVKNNYKPFATSFKDYVNDLIVTENVGVAIEKTNFQERLVIRPLEEFYLDIVTVRLPFQVNKVVRKVAKKHYYSSITVGCAKGWENEEAQGLDEYNTQSNFITPITRIKNDFKRVTKYVYATLAGELIRRKQKITNGDTDHKYDKDIFGFSVKENNNYNALSVNYKGNYSLKKHTDVLDKEPTGIYSPETAYNLEYSPVNILMKHSWEIACSLASNLKDYVRYGSSKGNSQLSTQIKNQKEYAENEDIICKDFGYPRFLPETIEFEHKYSFDVKEQLEGTTIINGKEMKNIYGLIEFTNEKGEIELGRFESLKLGNTGKFKLLKAS